MGQKRRGLSTPEGVTIAVVVFCLAFLLVWPVLGHNPPSRRSATISSAKQLCLGFLMYAGDYDGVLPAAGAWQDLTLPYVKNEPIYIDPSIKSPKPGEFGFAFFEPLSSVDSDDVLNAPDVPLVFQSTLLGRNSFSDLSTLPNPPRYEDRNVIGFLDCHVKPHAVGFPSSPVKIDFKQGEDEK